MKDIFGNNLKKLRHQAGWTQEKAAIEIGVGRPAYGAWEEGRSFPRREDLVKVARTFRITDLIGLIENEHFDPNNQLKAVTGKDKAVDDLMKKYRNADIRVRLAVNILLGIVDVDN